MVEYFMCIYLIFLAPRYMKMLLTVSGLVYFDGFGNADNMYKMILSRL